MGHGVTLLLLGFTVCSLVLAAASPPAPLPRPAGVILGGGAGSRLYPLTKERAKPAVPIAGQYRLIDIPISNCLNSSIK